MKRGIVVWSVVTLFCSVTTLFSKEVENDAREIVVSNMISSNMVLQQKAKCHIWGHALPKGTISVEIRGVTKTTKVNKKGEWDITLKKMKAGGPYTLLVIGEKTIKYDNIMVGDVWLCSGQSNMEQTIRDLGKTVSKESENIRFLKVKKTASITLQDDIEGKWSICSPKTASDFSAVGYYFGKKLNQDLGDLPIGLVQVSWGSTGIQSWTSYKAMKKNKMLREFAKDFKKKAGVFESLDKEQQPFVPTVLYNGMVYPLKKLPIKGVIWYQGEANVGDDISYAVQLTALIKDWRKLWKKRSMPFIIAQLSSFKSDDENWAEFRQEQYNVAMKIPKTGIAMTADVGNGTLHPDKKKIIGERLALVAEKLAYKRNVVYSGPTYDSMSISGNTIRVKFKNVGGGLVAKEGPLKQFFIAGKDKKFVKAQAKIEGSFVILSAESVEKPKYVRYAWCNNPEGCNLYNKEGLPAFPFKTDKSKKRGKRRR